ncbi:hypothetical protein L1049_009438 [Liquidambar formosana]|uniref:Fe2OG dioxygenase domain-containing protein n=1 Tax=Liquidambar formosana TaxID=63359 RepID=A0AAP0X9Z5_LIQFO
MAPKADETAVKGQDVAAYAASMTAQNVQEMVRRDPSFVPERYIQKKEDMTKATDAPHLSPEIPVIDLSLLSKGHEDELKKLDLACEDWGFLQVVNHGVAKEVLQGMKDAAAGFFELPLEEKNKYAVDLNDGQGYGLPYEVPQELKLDWSDALVLSIYPSQNQKLKYWPTAPKEFKEIVEAYSTGVKKVAEELLGSLSLVMGMMDKDALIRLHKEMALVLRVNYAPTCCKPDEVLSISPHSDMSTITILMQDDDLHGLQIRHDGKWVPVIPIPNALVVNVGDVIEIWSNGKYKSIEHRAITNKDRTRISFASFFFPHEDVELEPFNQMVDSQQPRKIYKKLTYGEYVGRSITSKLDGKAHIEMAKNKSK